MSVVKFLTEKGLGLRGLSDRFGRADNGNYLGILELFSEFEHPLKSQIETYGKESAGTMSLF